MQYSLLSRNMYVCVHTLNMWRRAQRPERAFNNLELDYKGCELQDMGAGNRTEVLWKGS